MFSQLIHSFSPLHQTPALSKVPYAMTTDDMSTTPVPPFTMNKNEGFIAKIQTVSSYLFAQVVGIMDVGRGSCLVVENVGSRRMEAVGG
ncbi:Receptor-type tyrosine-protein phosphatase beta [Gossypium arboreum]|uniref:Receptor-type tyrosine-protein phosphatase beta n=1 Tax=Gossypium arboreum TaxID=29729 RepID=A0A0B0NSJ5_GOSAR|nr:Receptor-type tyrosine-protein phosphatase beta [Gossypium arboreum]